MAHPSIFTVCILSWCMVYGVGAWCLVLIVAWLIANYSRTRRKAQIGLSKYYYKVQATAKHEQAKPNEMSAYIQNA